MRHLWTLAAIVLICLGSADFAIGDSVRVHGYTRKDGTYVAPYTRSSPSPATAAANSSASATTTTAINRDSNGHIERSAVAKNEFQSKGACPGYVIDHISPLKMGGPDNKSNMQWQTTEDAKAKDKVECGGRACSAR